MGPDRPDWSRLQRVRFRVRQHYRYTYTGPVVDLRHRLVMIPPDRHGDQRLLGHELAVRGTDDHRLVWETDEFGNRVCRVEARRIAHAVDFEVRYRVERRSGEHSALPDRAPFLQPTALTAPDRRIEEAARRIAAEADDPAARAELANDWAADALAYEPGVTGVQTPAAMALHLGRGVCQDFAHVLLALLRRLGVPARYVSGHLIGEGAPHAWVEALLPEVVAYDPTHRRRAGLGYVTVAVGRDFADVTPTSGAFTGAARGALSWSKEVEVEQAEEATA